MNVLMHELTASGIRIEAHGQRLRIDAPAGTLTPDLVTRIKAHKSELLAALQHPVNDTLTTAEHQTIRAWLVHIQEDDPAIIAEVLEKCRAIEVTPPDTDDQQPDDRSTCHACRHLRAGHCTARRHGIEGEASFRFRPHPDLPRRCAGFVEASSC